MLQPFSDLALSLMCHAAAEMRVPIIAAASGDVEMTEEGGLGTDLLPCSSYIA